MKKKIKTDSKKLWARKKNLLKFSYSIFKKCIMMNKESFEIFFSQLDVKEKNI